MAVLLGVTTLPVVAACTSQNQSPALDPLRPLAEAATADAAVAKEVANKYPSLAERANQVAINRQKQADALWQEVHRVNPGPTNTPTTVPTTHASSSGTDAHSAMATLVAALTSAQNQAADMVLNVPDYRAGLVGSVAAGCACLRELLS